jgi:hypothetical protein
MGALARSTGEAPNIPGGIMTYPHQPEPAPPVWGPQPPTAPTKNRRGLKIAAGVVGALVIFGIGTAAGGDSGDGGAAEAKPAPTVTETVTAKPKPAGEAEAKPAAKAKPKPKPEAKEYPDGDYIVGEDIPAGTYESAGAESDLFDFCSVTTEPTDASVMPQIKSANKGERIIITLAEKDGTVTVSGCAPLKAR